MKRRQPVSSEELWSDSNTKSRRCIWTEEEDQVLLSMAKKGKGVDWAEIAKALQDLEANTGPRKTAKQCRERWHNRVDPKIKQSAWGQEEINLFFELYQKHGPKWSKLASELPGRTDNTIKNFFYCKLRKMARRIKKGMISDDMKSSPKEIEHSLFLIEYLKAHYADSEAAQHPINDKYIAEMIRSASISLQKVNAYLKEYEAAVKYSCRNQEADYSLSKSQTLPQPDVLPLVTSDLATQAFKGEISPIPYMNTMFLRQLSLVPDFRPYKEIIILPLPNSFVNRKSMDSFIPTIDFLSQRENSSDSCCSLAQGLLCIFTLDFSNTLS